MTTGQRQQYRTVNATAKRLGVSNSLVKRFIRDGDLTAVNIGVEGSRPTWRIGDEDIARFIASRTISAA